MMPIKMKRAPSMREVYHSRDPNDAGLFAWNTQIWKELNVSSLELFIAIPSTDSAMPLALITIPILAEANEEKQGMWLWDGNEDEPTLTRPAEPRRIHLKDWPDPSLGWEVRGGILIGPHENQ